MRVAQEAINNIPKVRYSIVDAIFLRTESNEEKK
jgi:hypothetical protein